MILLTIYLVLLGNDVLVRRFFSLLRIRSINRNGIKDEFSNLDSVYPFEETIDIGNFCQFCKQDLSKPIISIARNTFNETFYDIRAQFPQNYFPSSYLCLFLCSLDSCSLMSFLTCNQRVERFSVSLWIDRFTQFRINWHLMLPFISSRFSLPSVNILLYISL